VRCAVGFRAGWGVGVRGWGWGWNEGFCCPKQPNLAADGPWNRCFSIADCILTCLPALIACLPARPPACPPPLPAAMAAS
jgi:hypothetical protein